MLESTIKRLAHRAADQHFLTEERRLRQKYNLDSFWLFFRPFEKAKRRRQYKRERGLLIGRAAGVGIEKYERLMKLKEATDER